MLQLVNDEDFFFFFFLFSPDTITELHLFSLVELLDDTPLSELKLVVSVIIIWKRCFVIIWLVFDLFLFPFLLSFGFLTFSEVKDDVSWDVIVELFLRDVLPVNECLPSGALNEGTNKPSRNEPILGSSSPPSNCNLSDLFTESFGVGDP